jgi:hypothetical protein
MNWARWWPLTGILFAVAAFISIPLSSGADTHDTDQQILAHYADHSNRVSAFVSFFLFLGAIMVLIWFLALLRSRLILAEGRAGLLTALPFGAGLVAAAAWVVANGLFTAPAAAISDTSKFQLDPNTYRLLNNLGYGVWFSGTTVMALLVFAVAVLSLRTGFLPKWLAWLSLLVGITLLVSFLFIPFVIFLGWLVVVSITLIARPWAPAAPATAV